jgi:hypothetical protein
MGGHYLIRLAGDSSSETNFQLALIADFNPLILKQPVSRTVFSNQCALFYVITSRTFPLGNTYQWFFNGNPIAGETAPMLSLTNVNGTMAGNYSVIVSNVPYGYTISQPATLTVSQSNVPVSLAATGIISNSLAFNLAGESGRFYRIQTSTNLGGWQNAANFPFSFQPQTLFGSVVQNTSTSMPLLSPQAGASAFIRALPYTAPDQHSDICINNLNQICIAKFLWMIDSGGYPTSWAAMSDIQRYFPHQTLPGCPDESTQNFQYDYRINDMQTAPTCLIKTNHLLEIVP